MMISGKDFIVFGLQPWDYEQGSNCKNIAIEIAKNNRVLYVNRPVERSGLYKFRQDPKIKNRLKSVRQGIDVLNQVDKNLWIFNPRVILESINWLPHGKIYNTISKKNAERLTTQIKWASSQLNFDNTILFNDNDFLKGFYLKEFLELDMQIYYIRDFLLSQQYFIKHGKFMEPGLMSKADLVVANSGYLADYARKYNPNSFDIGQGCELDEFVNSNHPMPDDMKGLKHPLIGYCGALLESRLDITLLKQLANHKKDWSIVLIGPEDAAFQKSSLHGIENIYFLGSKPASILPAYIHHMDVCINPQVVNQMTIGNYPRKIDEYLAAGKPVVATNTAAMQLFKEHCFLAKDLCEFIEGISKSLELAGNRELINKRQQFALSHSWESSVKALYKAIGITANQIHQDGKR